MKQHGFAPVILIMVLALISVGIAYFYGFKQGKESVPVVLASPSPSAGGTVCTMDAMQCPDGSYVGRTGPNCEFAPCPASINIDERAKLELSKTVAIPLDKITVEKIEEVQWSNGCLGCAEPEQMCTMAIEPGFRITLKASGKLYYVHTRADKFFKVCLNPENAS